jgi:hypothetical protein
MAGDLWKVDPGFLSLLIEQAQLGPLGDFREQREIRPGAIRRWHRAEKGFLAKFSYYQTVRWFTKIRQGVDFRPVLVPPATFRGERSVASFSVKFGSDHLGR